VWSVVVGLCRPSLLHLLICCEIGDVVCSVVTKDECIKAQSSIALLLAGQYDMVYYEKTSLASGECKLLGSDECIDDDER
jgi:hypothetical protein